MGHDTPNTPPPRQRRSCGSCFFTGCLSVVGIIVLMVVVSVAFLFFQGKRIISPAVDAYFHAMNDEDYEALYGMLSSDWRERRSRQETEDHFRTIRQRLGRCDEWQIVSARLRYGQAEARIEVRVLAQFEHDLDDVYMELVLEDREWRIQRLYHDAPALHDDTGTYIVWRAPPLQAA